MALSKWVYLLLWVIFSTLGLALVYGKLPMENDPETYRNSLWDVMYMTFDRIMWSMCVLFVMFACETVGHL